MDSCLVADTSFSREMPASTPYYPELKILPGNYRLIHQHVERILFMDGALFASGELLDTDQSSIADWRIAGDLTFARTDANVYNADSRLQSASVAQLRAAGTNYPESIRHYLELPNNIPERVRDLVTRLTLNQPTPYDQVMVIQEYLRQFPYSLKVPGVPSNREATDYFLFDLQKGYCDYFATSMAVMARLGGIPARLVVGFTSGTYDAESHRFVVVRANAHAWVEVYFPGIGWVEFEPTSNLPPIERLGEPAPPARK